MGVNEKSKFFYCIAIWSNKLTYSNFCLPSQFRGELDQKKGFWSRDHDNKSHELFIFLTKSTKKGLTLYVGLVWDQNVTHSSWVKMDTKWWIVKILGRLKELFFLHFWTPWVLDFHSMVDITDPKSSISTAKWIICSTEKLVHFQIFRSHGWHFWCNLCFLSMFPT